MQMSQEVVRSFRWTKMLVVFLPRWTHAQRLREIESHVNSIANLRRKKVQSNQWRIKLKVFAYLLNCTLGQEVRLLIVRIVVILCRLNARLEWEEKLLKCAQSGASNSYKQSLFTNHDHGTSSEQREKNQNVITTFPEHIRVKFRVLQLNSRYRKTTPRNDLSLSAADVMQCLTF